MDPARDERSARLQSQVIVSVLNMESVKRPGQVRSGQVWRRVRLSRVVGFVVQLKSGVGGLCVGEVRWGWVPAYTHKDRRYEDTDDAELELLVASGMPALAMWWFWVFLRGVVLG